MILAQLSDPHVEVGPGDAGSADSLAAAVRTVLALRPLPDAVLLSGDLAAVGAEAEYVRVRELLAPLPMPVHVLAGNHDDHELLRAHFPLPGGNGDGAARPYRYATEVAGVRLIGCDSTIAGRHDGALDVGWLEAQLDERPTVVAMHHPPISMGFPALDEIGLAAADVEALGGLLARSPQVRRVVAGHAHRAAFGVLGGCGVAACPTVHLSPRLDLGAPEYVIVREPPAIAVHVLTGGDVLTHVQPVTG
jgi:3',5'-cyclic AMP phosphodiesterase CpdA